MKKKLIMSAATFGFFLSPAAYGFENIGSSSTLFPPAPALEVNASVPDSSAKAHNFIQSLADRGIGFLSDTELSEETRKAQFRELLHDNFDMKTIARFSLGRYWKTCTETQRTEYLKLFEAMIVEVYSRRFSDYDGQKLKILKARPEGEKDTVVPSLIVPASGPEVKVDWRVREKDGKFKVVDIIVEGVSMSLTQRADFASVIQRGGGNVESLLTHLRPH